MSSSRKLFLATALLAAGYAVAHFLGSPSGPYLPRTSQADRASSQVIHARGPLSAEVSRSNPNLVGGARLLPDIAVSDPVKEAQAKPIPQIASIAKNPESPRLIAPAVDAVSIAPAAPAIDSYVVPQANVSSSQPPPASPALEIQPPANSLTAVSAAPREQTVSASFFASEPTSTSQAVFNAPVSPIIEQRSSVSPPPWPADTVAMRTHIIVDGDSLAKLAGRYLNDPQRGNEIFALNRNVLTSPELLPIGAEIRIPARQGMQLDDDPSPFAQPSAMSVTAAGQRGMAPISPVPTVSADAPRARLLGPVPVESPRAATQPPGY